MPTKKPIVTFVAEDDLVKRIRDFRFEERIETMSEAIRRLLKEALRKYEKKAKK